MKFLFSSFFFGNSRSEQVDNDEAERKARLSLVAAQLRKGLLAQERALKKAESASCLLSCGLSISGRLTGADIDFRREVTVALGRQDPLVAEAMVESAAKKLAGKISLFGKMRGLDSDWRSACERINQESLDNREVRPYPLAALS